MPIKLSVIVPVFNSGAYLSIAMHSILSNLNQREDFEIILVDDKSNDPKTIELIEEWSRLDRVRVIRLAVNCGPAKARNTGITAAIGEWVAFLDADDIMVEKTMERRFKLIEQFPYVKWIAGDVVELLQADELATTGHLSHIKYSAVEIIPGIFKMVRPTREMLGWGILPVLGAMMIRRDVFEEIGLLKENLIYGEDIHFCFLLSTHADLYWISEPCLYLRRHHISMMTDLFRNALEVPKASLALLKEPKLMPFRKELRWKHSGHLRLLSRAHSSQGNRMAAIISALMALRWSINDMRNFHALKESLIVKNI